MLLNATTRKAELVLEARRSFTRLSRFINHLMRAQLSCGPITVQQCYTLEALVAGPRSMNALAAEVALHQSTMTRIVEKLEKSGLVSRKRRLDDQRSVDVEITAEGEGLYRVLDRQCTEMLSSVIDLLPAERQTTVVQAMGDLADLLDPANEVLQGLLRECCNSSEEKEARPQS